MNLEKLKALNAQRWNAAKLTRHDFYQVAERLFQGKDRYRSVSQRTGVPWFVIAVIHEREADGLWDTHLGQGDPLGRPTRHVPLEPAFKTWEDGAYDALVRCPPFAARNRDWSVGGTLTIMEQYNGLAYANKGLPSPYIWAGTDQYIRGKIERDHGPIEWGVIDHQLGCAGLLMALREIDPSVRFDNEAMPPPDVHPPEPKQEPAPTPPPVPKVPKKAAPPAAGTLAGTIAHLLGFPIWSVVAVALAIAVAVYFITRRK